MSASNGEPDGEKEKRAHALMLEFLEYAIDLVRQALQQGRRTDAVKLYRGHGNDTTATAGALLSAWQSFVQPLDNGAALPEAVNMPELAALLIRRACNKMRRKDYRDQQMAEQVARGRGRGTDGELLPFDPADPRQRNEVVKNLPLEIEEVVGKRSKRDRLVIELYLQGCTYEEIVEQVRAALPEVPISIATVQRIIERFKDEMRGRLGDS